MIINLNFIIPLHADCNKKYTLQLHVGHADSHSCQHQLNKPTHLLIHATEKLRQRSGKKNL